MRTPLWFPPLLIWGLAPLPLWIWLVLVWFV